MAFLLPNNPMTKNRLPHLTDHLFLALERLNDEDLSIEQIQTEVQRAKAVADVSDKIIDIAKVSLEAKKVQADYLGNQADLPTIFDATPKLENSNA
ncbi:hypothetical protein ACT2CV_01210 [Pasteurellaceae bacterium 22721_9_1]